MAAILDPVLRFNSILVQLEAQLSCFAARHSSCFNSILVQLEVTKTNMDKVYDYLFQFHIGAIRSMVRSKKRDC